MQSLTMLVISKIVKETSNITKDAILKGLEELPESHCAMLVANVLHKVLEEKNRQEREDLFGNICC
jgi:NifU-like protein involved in Fe-S cluster formation